MVMHKAHTLATGVREHDIVPVWRSSDGDMEAGLNYHPQWEALGSPWKLATWLGNDFLRNSHS